MNAIGMPNEVIRASAGTGKTYELSSRYLCLLVDGAHPNSILATTFTRKAAGEILDRVVNRLADAALDEASAQQTAADIGRPGVTAARFGELLSQLIDNLHCLQIHTLDAFFAQIARAFSLEIGLPPNWEIVEEPQMRILENRAIRRVLTRRNALQIVFDLAKGEAKRGVSEMINQTVGDLYSIFRETHDHQCDQAWFKLEHQDVLSDEEVDAIVDQLVGFAPSGDKRLAKAFDVELANLRIEDWDGFLNQGLGAKAAGGDNTYHSKEIPPEIYQPLRRLAQHAVTISLNQLVAQTTGAYHFLQNFHEEFDRLKVQQGVLRFDDVNYLAQVLLRQYKPDGMAYRLDQHIDHLLLDEFQDTSVEQWNVLKPLAHRACQPSPNHSFFCVGDVKQAIYGWRGGVAEIFNEVENQFAGAVTTRSENKSYRSSPVIIDTVNQVFTNLLNHQNLDDKRAGFESWCNQFELHETIHRDLPGYASLQKTSSATDHYRQAAERIKQLYDQTTSQSMGVLVRTNDVLARLIFELGRVGVPASEEGGNPLTDAAAVNIILSMLRLIDHPDDLISRFHVLHSPAASVFGLTKQNWQNSPHACHAIAGQLRYRLMDEGYGSLLLDWSRRLSPYCTRREWFRLRQLIEQGYRVTHTDYLRPTDFVSWAESTQVDDPSASRVRVMTIHKSKGLEFDMVVLPHLDFGSNERQPTYIVGRDTPTSPIKLVCRYMDKMKREWLPPEFQTAFVQTETHQTHERLGNIYVAMTRARQGLYMIVPPNAHAGLRSAAGLIMAGLGIEYHHKKSQEAGRVLWELGTPHWFAETGSQVDQLQSKESSVQPPRPIEPNERPRAIHFAPSTGHRFRQWESPSTRALDENVKLRRVLELQRNQDARIHGTLVHRCFERVSWLDDEIPAPEDLKDYLRETQQADPRQISNAISAFRKAISRPHASGLLHRAHYQSDLIDSFDRIAVQCERKFVVRLSAAILSGAIDRLVLLFQGDRVVGADIIDYKTDKLSQSDAKTVQSLVDAYRPQVLSYRDAIAKIYGLDEAEVTARLLLVDIDRVVQIA